MFKFFTILAFLAISEAWISDKKDYDRLCDNVKAQTYLDFAPYAPGAPMIFNTQDVRIAWYDGSKTYLGKVAKPDVRAQSRVSKGGKMSKKGRGSKIPSYVLNDFNIGMPKDFFERLFKNQIKFEKNGTDDEVAYLPCQARFKMEFKINGIWFKISYDGVIEQNEENIVTAEDLADFILDGPKNPWCKTRFTVNTNLGTSYIYYGNPFWFHVCMTTNDPKAVPVYHYDAIYGMGHATKIGFAQKPGLDWTQFDKKYF